MANNPNARVKVTGGMDPTWMSTVRSGPTVKGLVTKATNEVVKLAETKAQSKFNVEGVTHFGSIVMTGGEWGNTGVVWSRSWQAAEDETLGKAAAEAAGLKRRS